MSKPTVVLFKSFPFVCAGMADRTARIPNVLYGNDTRPSPWVSRQIFAQIRADSATLSVGCVYIESVAFAGRLAIVALVLLAGTALAYAHPLEAGAAQAVITPTLTSDKPVYLAGFGHNRVASGVHDDLTARCLALSTGARPMVICAVDLIGLFYEDVLAVRQEFSQQTHSNALVIVAATHTHAGPDTLGLYGPRALASGVDSEYLSWIENRIAATAASALRAMQPARVEFGRDDHPLLALLQGVDRPPIVKDPYLFVMRVTARSNGKTIATLVNWSDHPEVLGRKNTEITCDYPHWVRAYLEARFGGIALFFSGAIGKVSPLGQVSLPDPETGEPAADGTWRKAELLGTEVGQLAERTLRQGHGMGQGHATNIDALSIRSETIFVPLENPLFRAAQAAGVFAARRPLYTNGKPDAGTEMRDLPNTGRVSVATGHDIRTEVDYVQLRSGAGPVAEIVAIPGEIYPELVNGGIARLPGADYPQAPFEPVLRAQLKTSEQFLLGLGNDEIGYLIPKAEWDAEPPWLNHAPAPWYGEINSPGPDAAGAVLRALSHLVAQP